MKKKVKFVIAVVISFSVTMSAYAQFSTSENSRKPARFHMGIRGGMTGNTYIGDHSNSDEMIFATGGIALDFQIAPIPLFIGLGANYVDYGIKASSRYGSDTEHGHSVQVPLTISYHIGVAPNFFINPFVGGFAAYNFNDNFDKQFNGGLRFGCGLNYRRLTFDAGYDLGLANLGKKNNDIRTGTFFVTIGFNWAGSR